MDLHKIFSEDAIKAWIAAENTPEKITKRMEKKKSKILKIKSSPLYSGVLDDIFDFEDYNKHYNDEYDCVLHIFHDITLLDDFGKFTKESRFELCWFEDYGMFAHQIN